MRDAKPPHRLIITVAASLLLPAWGCGSDSDGLHDLVWEATTDPLRLELQTSTATAWQWNTAGDCYTEALLGNIDGNRIDFVNCPECPANLTFALDGDVLVLTDETEGDRLTFLATDLDSTTFQPCP